MRAEVDALEVSTGEGEGTTGQGAGVDGRETEEGTTTVGDATFGALSTGDCLEDDEESVAGATNADNGAVRTANRAAFLADGNESTVSLLLPGSRSWKPQARQTTSRTLGTLADRLPSTFLLLARLDRTSRTEVEPMAEQARQQRVSVVREGKADERRRDARWAAARRGAG